MLTPSRHKTLFARGESDANLRKHYFEDTSSMDQLLYMIFCIGEKGRICLNDNDWIDPDDISIDNFSRIYAILNTALKTADKGSPYRRERMAEFISENKRFADAFLSEKKAVLNKYNNLGSEERKKINLYYLAILHTINSNQYKNKSIFVSTSQNIEVAEHFEQDLMFIGWVPKSYSLSYIAFKKNNNFTSICDSVGLPKVNIPVYPEQAEISVRYGILPHFLIGVKVKNVFYVNPAIYETMELFSKCTSIKQMRQLRTDIIKNGLMVDQT
ncbi:MAG: hypothetical protein HDR74_07105 [Bacteroides sp.]|nr:hypothetical protein [Bacteroides sp.]